MVKKGHEVPMLAPPNIEERSSTMLTDEDAFLILGVESDVLATSGPFLLGDCASNIGS